MWQWSVRSTVVGCHAITEDWIMPFAADTATETPNSVQWAGQLPKTSPSHRGSWPHLIPGSFSLPESAPNGISICSALFCRKHPCEQNINRQTYRQTTLCATSIASSNSCDTKTRPQIKNLAPISFRYYAWSFASPHLQWGLANGERDSHWKWQTFWLSRARDLDFGLGHIAHRHASLIDLYLCTKLH